MCVVLIIIKFFCLACIHNNPLYPWLFSSWHHFLIKWSRKLQFYFPPHAISRDISLNLFGTGDTFVPFWFLDWIFLLIFHQNISLFLFWMMTKICLIQLSWLRLVKVVFKGQLISKCLFGVFNFFQKTNENTSHI